MPTCRLLPRLILGGLVLTIAAADVTAQTISVNPQSLSFVYQIGGSGPAAQNIYLSSDIPAQFSVTIAGAPWLTISPLSGVTPATLTAIVTPPANATPGTLSGQITIGPPASTSSVRIVIPVSLQILAPPQGNLVVAPSSLVAEYRIGGPVPPLMPITITSTGGPAAFSVTSSTTSGGQWLAVSAPSLVTPAIAHVAITPTSALTPGVYTGSVAVTPAGGGAVRLVLVTLRVYSAGSIIVSPTYLTFEYETSGPIPAEQYLRVTDSLGGVVPFNVSATTSTGSWLSVAQSTGVTPATVVVRVIPAAMPPGTHYGTLSFQPSPTGQVTQIPVSLTITNAPQLRINPNTLSFAYQLGGPAAPAQYISVSSTGSPVPFRASIVGPAWITVPDTAYVTPGAVPVSVNPPATTSPGTYTAAVMMTPSTPGSNAVSAQVTVDVKAANLLSLSRSAVSFVYSPGGSLPNQVVSVTSSGGAARFQAAASSSWVALSQTASYTPANLTISVLPQGLAPGTYHDKVNVFSDDVTNSPQTVDVTLTISTDPLFSAVPFGLMFSHQIGVAPQGNQLAVITNTMAGQEYTVSAETENGGNWLVVAGSGTAPAAVAAAVDTRPLTYPGTYTGTLVVTPRSSTTPMLRVPVVVNVSAGPALRANSSLLAFQYQTGGPAIAAQKLSVTTTSGSASFYTSAKTADGGAWLKVTPDFASSPADLTVTADPAGLTPGTYLGLIALTGTGQEGLFYYIPVSLQVSSGPILTVAGQSLSFTGEVGGPRPAAQTVKVASTGEPAGISSTGSAAWLQVQPASAQGSVDLSVQPDTTGLEAGYHLGLITIRIPDVTNSEQYIPVALSLNPPPAR